MTKRLCGRQGLAAVLLILLASILAPEILRAQQRDRRRANRAPASKPNSTASLDPEIKRIVAEIDAKNTERTVRKLVSFGTRNTLSAQDNPTRGIGAARDFIYNEFLHIKEQSNGRLTVERQRFEQPVATRIPRPTPITNVVATLRGRQTQSQDRIYVVSGHYDSMCGSPTDGECDAPGANDDASGVAAVLEMARVMAKREFDATIIFMAVAGEEQGLLGAAYFAEQAKQKGLNIEAMFTNDIVGNTLGVNGVRDRRRLRVFSEGVPSDETPEQAKLRQSVGGENDSPARQLARFIKETSERYVPDLHVQIIYRRDRYGRGGDHIPFLERGFAAVRFCEPNENYNHQHQNVRSEKGTVYGDLPEFVDFAYIAQVARANAAALATLARAPAAPKDVRIVTRRLTNDTDLQWAANTEPDLAGYEIVWRDTADSLWTNSQMVGGVTSYTMRGMSKDNYFFGVRAVDQQGHRSRVVFPRPVR
ncbi:MAG: M20/M25/M40 family metallo-hydrolase [Pyrinomonadaceae bacterium]|nr:M20/M25/M40 family metallo-hydrolase [Pyrinomonadaceae bacterium]